MISNDHVRPTVIVAWQFFGPYHIARLRELRGYCPSWAIYGLEIADKNSTYNWARDEAPSDLITLFPGRIAEHVSGAAVFSACCQKFIERRVDVVLVPSFWPIYSLAIATAAKLTGCRTVIMTESHLGTEKKSTTIRVMKRALLFLFDSAFVGGSPQRRYLRSLGMSGRRIFDGYDVVDNAFFAQIADSARDCSEKIRGDLRLPDRFILSIGRFVKKKNLPFIVEAYAIALRQTGLGGNRLVFVGDGPELREIESAAQNYGLSVMHHRENATSVHESVYDEAAVHFYPFAQIDKTPLYYALATASVLASHCEEWGLVVNESMAAGCPVLVSETVGAAEDLVSAGTGGWTFSPRDVAQLADCLNRVCIDPETSRLLGRASEAHIASWSLERFARSAAEAVRSALK